MQKLLGAILVLLAVGGPSAAAIVTGQWGMLAGLLVSVTLLGTVIARRKRQRNVDGTGFAAPACSQRARNLWRKRSV